MLSSYNPKNGPIRKIGTFGSRLQAFGIGLDAYRSFQTKSAPNPHVLLWRSALRDLSFRTV